MNDMEIPQAAVEAVHEARGAHRDASECSGRRCSCGQGFPTAVKQLEHETRALLGAALPHLQADTKAMCEPDQICCDIACPGLANCKDPDCVLAKAKPFMEGATELGRRLGRQEAAEEIATAIEVKRIMDGRQEPEQYFAGRYSAFDESERIAREIGKGNPS